MRRCPPDDAFDAVACVDVLKHVFNIGAVLQQVARILRLGGRFMFDTINRDPLASLVTVALAKNVPGLLPPGSDVASMFIKPAESRSALRVSDWLQVLLRYLGPVV